MPPRVIETITAAALWVCLPSFLPCGVFHRAVERRLAYGTHHEPDPAPGRGRDPLKKEGGEGPGAFRGENSPLYPRAPIHRRPEKGKRPLCDDGGRGRLQRGAGGGQGQEQASLPAPGAEALCVSHRDPHVSAPACGGGERSGGPAGGAVSGESGASARFAGAGPGVGAAGQGCGSLLAGWRLGPGVQRPVWRGRRRDLLRRQAHHRHP